MKHMLGKTLVVLAAVAISLAAFCTAKAQDYEKMLKEKEQMEFAKEKKEEEHEPIFDPSQKIFLTSPRAVYEPEDKPEIQVYLKNDGDKTRYYKRVWSAIGAEGVHFRIFFDQKEMTGSSIFSRESVGTESADPDDAIRLDPGERAMIMKIHLNSLVEGEHTLRAVYQADYRVTESVQRNWWNGAAQSNILTMNAERVVEREALSKAAAGVIRDIHSTIKSLGARFPAVAGYGDQALTSPPDAFMGIPVIEYSTLKPQRVNINIYFQESEYRPSSMALFSEDFPYLGLKLFAHIEAGNDQRLRNAVLGAINTHKKQLYGATRELASNVRIEILPLAPEISKELRRAVTILKGEILGKEVEEVKPFDYSIRKWILDVKVEETLKGEVAEPRIKVKSGAINSFFGDEDPGGKSYVLMLSEKNKWQNEYTLIGVEPVYQELLDWLKVKYSPE